MKSFIALVRYEYKKLFSKKLIWISLILFFSLLIFSIFGVLIGDEYIDGKRIRSNAESIALDTQYAKALNGREISTDLLLETARAYSKIPSSRGSRLSSFDEYQKYARPYSEIRGIMGSVYNYNTSQIQSLTKEEAENFYEIRSQRLGVKLKDAFFDDDAIKAVMDMDKQLKTPFIFYNHNGYYRFLMGLSSISVFLLFIIGVCVTPIFTDEYSYKTDRILLSSRTGKDSLIWAKIFTGLSLSSLLTALSILMCYIMCMVYYGWDGGNAPIQLLLETSPYPITMGQFGIIFSTCIFLTSLMFASFCLLLSSRIKSRFGTLAVITTVILCSIMIPIPNKKGLIPYIAKVLPGRTPRLHEVGSPIIYDIFGMYIKPYTMFNISSIIIGSLLIPIIYRCFRNHQVA